MPPTRDILRDRRLVLQARVSGGLELGLMVDIDQGYSARGDRVQLRRLVERAVRGVVTNDPTRPSR